MNTTQATMLVLLIAAGLIFSYSMGTVIANYVMMKRNQKQKETIDDKLDFKWN